MTASRFSEAVNLLQQTTLSTPQPLTPLMSEHSLVTTEPSHARKVLSHSRSATKRSSVQRDPGDTPTKSKDVGTLVGQRSFQDSVGEKNGRNDRNDYYRFSLEGESKFSLSLNKLKANADVQLLGSSGETIATSKRRGKKDEKIDLLLDVGTYYVRVYPRDSATTGYRLILQEDRTPVPPVVSPVIVIDSPPQIASVTANPLTTTGSNPYTFSVTYGDDVGINTSSIDSNDIFVTSANGFQQTATFVSSTASAGTSQATYQLTAPQGGWNASNDGTYQLVLQPDQVSDSSGNFAVSATIGSFAINIGTPHVASFVAAALTTRGQTTPYTFSVTYSDNTGINASSVDSNDILVTGVNGFQQAATFVNGTSVGTAYTATYQLTAPQGSWAASNSGTYQLVLQPNQVSDSSGNFAASATIGSFQVNITNPYSSLYGYGSVDASAAVARAIGQAPFPGVPDGTFSLDANKAWQVDAVNAPEAWAKGFKGEGVVVAVIDSGVKATNPYLTNNLWKNSKEIPFNNIDDDKNGRVDDVRGWNFVNNNNSLDDTDGHGTFVTGVIADSITGIAPNTKVMPIKVVADNGFISQTNLADGIFYAVRNGAKIINISSALPPGSKSPLEVQLALKFAYDSHVLVVASAGNYRQPSLFQPGALQPNDPSYFIATNNYGITVGATGKTVTNQTEKFADFSNPAGNTPLTYLVAPGVDVYSDKFDFQARPTFEKGSGTSFSAPVVAAIAALMLSANPNLTPDQIIHDMIDTADPNVFV
jgi:hypothetical protein